MKGGAELVLEARPRASVVRGLRELWAYRDTVLAFAERFFRVRYKQTLLGVAWSVMQPLLLVAVFTVALGRLADVPGGGVPYIVFSLSAFIAWTALQGGVTFGANALVTDQALLKKVYFPREAPTLAAQLTAGIDLLIGLALFAALGPLLGATVSVTWLLAPLLGVGLLLVGAGVSLALAGLTVYYRDFRHALPFLLQLWLFASPVAYPMTVVPERWQTLYAFLNPAAGFLDGFRRTLALGELPDGTLVAASSAGALLVAAGGYALFKALEPNMADVV